MTGQHTQGPWGDGNEAICVKMDRERPWAGTVFRKAHDGSEANALVAMTFGATVEEAAANARLVGAAPELLEVAQTLCSGWLVDEHENPDLCMSAKHHEAISSLFAAIAKAEGR